LTAIRKLTAIRPHVADLAWGTVAAATLWLAGSPELAWLGYALVAMAPQGSSTIGSERRAR
jgi:hypothetical protein